MDWVVMQHGSEQLFQLETQHNQEDGWKTVGGNVPTLENSARFIGVQPFPERYQFTELVSSFNRWEPQGQNWEDASTTRNVEEVGNQ